MTITFENNISQNEIQKLESDRLIFAISNLFIHIGQNPKDVDEVFSKMIYEMADFTQQTGRDEALIHALNAYQEYVKRQSTT